MLRLREMQGSAGKSRGRTMLPASSLNDLHASADPVIACQVQHSGRFCGNMHHHHRAQLIYAPTRRADVETRENRWVLHAGQAAWLPSGVEHKISSTTSPVLRSLYVRPDLTGPFRDTVAIHNVSGFLDALLQRLLGLYEGHGNASTYEPLVALILSELEGVSAHSPNMPPHLPVPDDECLQTICTTLLDCPSDTRTLEEWSKEVGLSVRTLERRFRQETSMSFVEWRRLCRILGSLSDVKKGTPIKVIAWNTGYESVSAYSSSFRKVIGQSPAQYRLLN